MTEKIKVVIKIEYECDGIREVCVGLIEESKVEPLELLMNSCVGDENFVWMENDGNGIWKDIESIISIQKMGVISTLFERPSSTNNNADTGICS